MKVTLCPTVDLVAIAALGVLVFWWGFRKLAAIPASLEVTETPADNDTEGGEVDAPESTSIR